MGRVIDRQRGSLHMAVYRSGDIVYRRKGLFRHKGIVLADGRILHNTPFRGEHVSSPSEFGAGKRIRVEERGAGRPRVGLESDVVALGRRYNLLTNNCEHTVNRHARGRAESPQLREWIAGIGLGSLAFALTRHPAAAAAGYALGRTLGRRL